MFATTEDVNRLTGFNVELAVVKQAQGIVEAFAGRTEIEVVSVNDKALMQQATAYQAAYMNDNFDRTFQQAAVKQIAQSDGMITLDTDRGAPFLAPLAFIAIRKLSWKQSRSIRTGPVHAVQRAYEWSRD